ncbi:FAD binding domain-containing protein [Chloroflexota bacterium]
MRGFEYFAPQTLEEAIGLLSQYDGRAKVMAGGTDLLIQMRNRELQPQALIDLKRIPDLDSINYDNEGLKMGALVRIRDIETSDIVRGKYNVLGQAAGTLGSVQVRNRATVGGNLCNAAPSADMAPVLIGLGATLETVGRDGERNMPLEEFFLAMGETVLEEGEILTGIRVPSMVDSSDGVYIKFAPRKAMELAVVGVASILTMDAMIQSCLDIRIVLLVAAPTPTRATRAEAMIRGNRPTDSLIKEAAKVAAEEAKPRTTPIASEWYRRALVEELVNRSISQSLKKVKARRG